MKKLLALFLALALAACCFAGCGEDTKDKDNNKENDNGVSSGDQAEVITFEDIKETVTKLGEGAEVDVTLSIAVKPVFDESFTAEDFEAQVNGLLIKNKDGLYEIPLTLSGVANETSGKIDLKIANKVVSDLVIADENIYLNAKSAFDFIFSFAGVELAWPCENEYIDLVSFISYIQTGIINQTQPEADFEINEDIYFDDSESFNDLAEFDDQLFAEGDIFAEEATVGYVNNIFGMLGLSEEEIAQFEVMIEIISTSIPTETLNELLTKVKTILVDNKILIIQGDHISVKIDKTNIKPTVLAFAELIKTDAANIVDYVIQGIIKSDKLDEEDKEELTSGYDKAEFQADLNESIDMVELGESLDNMLAEIQDTHVYVSFGVEETSASFAFDILLDGLSTEEAPSEISQMALKFEANCKVKEVEAISAPTKILTEAEINTLMVFLSTMMG